MKRTGKRVLFWILLLVFTAAVGWWAQYVPRGEGALLRTVPAHVTYVSTHESLAGRWDDLLGNPVIRSLFRSMSLDLASVEEMGADPGFRFVLDRVASTETLFAHLPAADFAGRGAWMFASWLGGESLRLRWLLAHAETPGLERRGIRNGHVIWRYRQEDLAGRSDVHFVIVEGILLGCIAESGHIIEQLADTFDGRSPRATVPAGLGAAPVNAKDRGWAKWVASGKRRAIRFALHHIGGTGLDASVYLPSGIELPPGMDLVPPLRDLEGVFSEAPLVALLASPDWVREGFRTAGRDHPLLEGWDQVLSCALVSGAYSTRLKGIKVPGLLFGVRAETEEEADALVGRLLDALNAEFHQGLIAARGELHGLPAWTLEQTREGGASWLKDASSWGLVHAREWLILAPEKKTLDQVARAGARELSGLPAVPSIAADISGSDAGVAWLDLAAGASTLRTLIKIYSLKLLLESPDRSADIRRRLRAYQAWIDSLAPMKTCRIFLRDEGAVTRLQVVLGEKGNH